jgi:hypothetical protein
VSTSDKGLTREAAYFDWLASVKSRIHATRMKMALAANGELIALYYELGAQINEREATAKWGSGFIESFSGFSAKNLRYCRSFFRFYCDPAIWQQAVAKLVSEPWFGVDFDLAQRIALIPWGHHIQIVGKCSGLSEAAFYIGQTIDLSWSRDVLALQLKSKLYDRAGKAVTNFAKTLPAPQSDLAQQTSWP